MVGETERPPPVCYRAGYRLGSKTPALVQAAIPDNIRKDLYGQTIASTCPISGWWLLQTNLGLDSCFNPLLPWPQNYSGLPNFPFLDVSSRTPIKAGFSTSDPATGDWTILVAGGFFWSSGPGPTFCTFRRGDWLWKSYNCDYLKDQACWGVGFREGEFFCLFNRGDVLVFGIDGGGRRRMMLIANSPPPPLLDKLRVVEREGGESSCAVVISWERDCESGDIGDVVGRRRRYRLATVERSKSKAEVEAAAAAEMEAGESDGRAVVFVRKHLHLIKRMWDVEVVVGLFVVFLLLLIFGVLISVIQDLN